MTHVRNLIASDPAWVSTLETKYLIKVTRDDDLVSLKYNQIESPMHEPIVQECRGMVVHEPTGTILAHPYNKFWNHGDVPAAAIDWPTARVMEKLDGSLMILYWHAEMWCVASSGTPRAGGTFGNESTETFRDAFWRVWSALGMELPGLPDVCFMFEFCAQENRIVVRHETPRIVLHGARDMRSGHELSIEELTPIAESCRWEIVKTYSIATVGDCLTAADALDPIQNEGFVVVDAAFNRVKIKSPRYVILHHLKGEATPRRAIELWQTGEAGELLSHFPEMAPAILPIHEQLDGLAVEATRGTITARAISPDRKAFAACVSDKNWRAVAFKLFSGGVVTVDATKALMRGLTTQALERMLEAAP